MERFIGVAGLVFFVGVAIACSTNRKKINWRTVVVGLIIQFFIGFLLLKFEPSAKAFGWFTGRVAEFLNLADKGSNFIFGSLGDMSKHGFVFVIKVIPTIIFFSAFISIMYYLGVVQAVISAIAWVMRKTMGTSGAETLSCSGNIFVGQTEAPLLIRPYLDGMTNSELMAVMTGGFATVAGGVLALYIGMGVSAHHLIVGSVMAAPGALVMAKILVPETEHSQTAGDAKMPKISTGDNVIDAAARGTTDGLQLAINVVAMLIAFISLIAVVDWILGGLDGWIDGRLMGGQLMASGEYAGWFPGSLKTFFGYLFAPVAYIMGVPAADMREVGNLLGIKICLNEAVAYGELSQLIQDTQISPRAATIATYALCGFANFSSIGIQIGGIGALAPGRRSELARLGLRAMIGGAAVTCITATIAGLLVAS